MANVGYSGLTGGLSIDYGSPFGPAGLQGGWFTRPSPEQAFGAAVGSFYRQLIGTSGPTLGVQSVPYYGPSAAETPQRVIGVPVQLPGEKPKAYAKRVKGVVPFAAPTVGVNIPVLPGSREDPRGLHRPVFFF